MSRNPVLMSKAVDKVQQKEEEEEGEEEFVVEPIREVHVDALVALKIEKHAKETYPSSTSGALFGLDQQGVLKVTNSFRYLNTMNAEEDSQAQDQYQVEIMRHLGFVNADSFIVGWYQTNTLSNFLNSFWLHQQMDYQSTIPNSVVLVFDPLRSTTGLFSLRAFRLTEAFVQVLKTKSNFRLFSDTITTSGLLKEGWIMELPVYIQSSSLVSAFMYDLPSSLLPTTSTSSSSSSSCSSPISRRVWSTPMLPNTATPLMERQVSGFLDSIESFIQEETKYVQWQRNYLREKSRVDYLLRYKKDEQERKQILSKLPYEPNKLDTLLISQQLIQQADQLSQLLPPAALAADLAKQSTTTASMLS